MTTNNEVRVAKDSWTEFMDMHSGGGQKLAWSHIWIEAPEDEARRVFYARFGRKPSNVTCDCCGDDYSISSHDSLLEATAYNRGLRSVKGTFDREKREWVYPGGKCYLEPDEAVPKGAEVSKSWRKGNGVTLDAFLAGPHDSGIMGCVPLVIYAKDITDAERRGPKGLRQEKVWTTVDDE